MLNIFNIKLNNSSPKVNEKTYKQGIERGQPKHYPPANKEWYNSIYAYNKNSSKLLPVADKSLLKLIKWYFNLYSPKLEQNIIARPLLTKVRRLSSNRTIVSKAELKHTNEKVIITIYIYNRYQKNYLKRIENLLSLNKLYTKFADRKLNNILIKCLKIIKNFFKQEKILFETLNMDKKMLKNYENNYVNKYLIFLLPKFLHQEMLYFYLTQIIYINKSKFNSNYLLPLTSLIRKIYKKKIQFNLVNLKYIYLNSYIFTDTIVKRVKDKKNYVGQVLNAALQIYKLPPIDNLVIYDDMYNVKKKTQNLKVSNVLSNPIFFKHLQQEENIRKQKVEQKGKRKQKYLNNSNYNNDTLGLILSKMYSKNLYENKNKLVNNFTSPFTNIVSWSCNKNGDVINKQKKHVTNTVFNFIKYKIVSGIRIEAAGRLNKHYTAQRSNFSLRYKGSIQNLDSSYKGLSTVILRGHAKSNAQYTKLNSKRHVGAFGIKGWVSSN